MVNLYFVATFILVYINLFILAPLITKHLSYNNVKNGNIVDKVKNNVVLKNFMLFNKTNKSSLHIKHENIKSSRDLSDVLEVHRIVKREDDDDEGDGDDEDEDEKDDDDKDDEKDDDDDDDDTEGDEKDDKEKDNDESGDDNDKNPKSNVTTNENDTSDSFDVDENLPTTTKLYVYPYTSKDKVIDFVSDNGIKYTSTSSDQMQELNETSDTSENFARITDNSEPLHFVISGESDLSHDSEEDIGIEDLLPDYVKPTIPGQEEAEEKTERINEEDEIVLSEEIETTTTEATTRYQNSYEFHGERYESSEEGNMTLTTTSNSTDVSDDFEYKDDIMISTTLIENITSTASENITVVNETTTEMTTSTTTHEPVTQEILLDTTTSTTTTPTPVTKKKKLSIIDTVESEEIQNMTRTFSTGEDAEDYDPFGENNFSVFHPYSKENTGENIKNNSEESVEIYTVLDDLEVFTTPHYLNLHLKPTNKTIPLLLKSLQTDDRSTSESDSSYEDDSSALLSTPHDYTTSTFNTITGEVGSNTTESIYFNNT